jgi:uncharacterized protein YraI
MKPLRIVFGALIAALIFGLGALPVFGQSNEALLRFVHVVPGASSIDVYVNGQLAIRELRYGSASSYIGVSAGDNAIVVTQTGVTTPLWQQTVGSAPGTATTLIASSTQTLRFTAYSDDLNPLPFGKTRLTAAHAVEGAGAVDVVLGDGRVVIPSLGYNQPFGTFDIEANTYSFGVVPAGGTLDNPILPAADFALNTNTSYIIVVYGTANQPSFLTLSAPTRAEVAGGFVRIGHGIPEAPAVDIYVNDTLIAPALAFGQITDYLAIPIGTYSVAIRLPGADSDLLSGTLGVTRDSYTSAFALATGGTPTLDVFPDPAANISATVSALTLINRLTSGTASASVDDVVLISSVPSGGVGTASLPSGIAAISIAADTGTTSAKTTLDLPGGIYGGVHYTVLVTGDEPQITAFAPASIAQTVASAPGSGAAPAIVSAPTDVPAVAVEPTQAEGVQVIIVTATPTPDSAAQPQVIVVTATPTPPVIVAPTLAPTPGIVARVVLNPGANLQLRQYPSSQALSLGLAPSNSALRVLGREGEAVPLPGATATPTLEPDVPTPTPIPDPASLLEPGQDLDPQNTWLFVIYDTPDGGTINAWVNALYVSVLSPEGRTVPLRDLPTIPRNRAGVAANTSIQPPSASQDIVTVVVGNLSPGVNVHIRRTPATAGESLALVSSGTTLEVLGVSEERDWAFVRYADASGGGVRGWVSLEFVSFQLNGAPTDLEALEARNQLVITPDTERGSTFAGGIAPQPAPTINPVRDAIIGEVRLNPGANLHLRRRPNVNAESLALIPSGTQLIVNGQNETGEWLSVTFEGIDGWVFGSYLVLTRNGRLFEFQDVPLITSTPSGTVTPESGDGEGILPSGEAGDGEDFDA